MQSSNMIFSVLVLCTQMNMIFVMLLWVYIWVYILWCYSECYSECISSSPGVESNITNIIFTWVHNKIILLDCIGIEGTRFCSEISHTRTDLTT
jgi:hypothetical protein